MSVALSKNLPFSRDLVGEVASYVTYPTAKSGGEPIFLFSFSTGTAHVSRIRFAPDDSVWCSDGMSVAIFSSNGAFIRDVLGGVERHPLLDVIGLPDIHDFTLDSQGHAFFTELEKISMCRLRNSSVSVIRCFAARRKIRELDGLSCPVVDAQGLLYVIDDENSCVQVLSSQGDFLRSIGEDVLESPQEMALSSANEIFIADDDCQVKVCRELFLIFWSTISVRCFVRTANTCAPLAARARATDNSNS